MVRNLVYHRALCADVSCIRLSVTKCLVVGWRVFHLVTDTMKYQPHYGGERTPIPFWRNRFVDVFGKPRTDQLSVVDSLSHGFFQRGRNRRFETSRDTTTYIDLFRWNRLFSLKRKFFCKGNSTNLFSREHTIRYTGWIEFRGITKHSMKRDLNEFNEDKLHWATVKTR